MSRLDPVSLLVHSSSAGGDLKTVGTRYNQPEGCKNMVAIGLEMKSPINTPIRVGTLYTLEVHYEPTRPWPDDFLKLYN